VVKATVVPTEAAGRAPQGASSRDFDQWAVVSDVSGTEQETGYNGSESSRPTYMPRLPIAPTTDRYSEPVATQHDAPEVWSHSQGRVASSSSGGQEYDQSNNRTSGSEIGTYQRASDTLDPMPDTYVRDNRTNPPLRSNVYDSSDLRSPSDGQSTMREVPYSSSRPVQSARDGAGGLASSGQGSDARYSFQSPPEVPNSSSNSWTSSSGSSPPDSFRQPEAESIQSQDGTYTVRPNDSYWTIAMRAYGSGACFKALAEHNRKKHPEPDRLRVGDVILLPPQSQLQQSYPQLCPKPVHSNIARRRASAIRTISGDSNARIYVVESGDTLYDIARFELGKASRWDEIVELNADVLGKDLDYLTPGMKLILPKDRSSDSVTQRVNSAYPR